MVDAVVAGGGPAGSTCALLLARAGLTVTLVERATFPRRKVCVEYLNSGAVAALDRLGVLNDVRAQAYALRGVRLVPPRASSVELPFTGGALSCERETLDAILLRAAVYAGVTVVHGRVEDLLRDFKGQLAQFEQAAGISDPASQLSAAAHYQPVTPELSARYMAILQQRLDERTKSSGNGWMSAMNALQGVANIQQSMQDAKAADLTHNTAGQMRAVANGTTAEMQTLGAVSGNTTIIQPLAPASSTQTQPTAAQSTVAVSVQAAQPQTYTKTYTTTQNNGDLVKQTIFAGAPGAQITIQCFAPGQTQPYKTQTFTHSSSSEFFMNLPPVCTRTASAAAPPSSGTGTGTAKPPVPYTPAPSSGGTVVATNGTICPPSGWIMHQTGDVSVGEQCTPGQPISSTTSSSGSGGSGAGNGGDSGGSSLRYVDALSTSCISMDFNANYHWDEYMNNCGVVLSLTYVFPNGTAGTFDHLSPGKPEGSGHSRADYQADGGNPISCNR